MENPLREILNVCRLCLCQDDKFLSPIKQIVDPILSSDDIERFTGIQIDAYSNALYAFCVHCIHKLRKCISFRNTCLGNDVLFKQLYSVFISNSEHILESDFTAPYSNETPFKIEFVVEKIEPIDFDEPEDLRIDESTIQENSDHIILEEKQPINYVDSDELSLSGSQGESDVLLEEHRSNESAANQSNRNSSVQCIKNSQLRRGDGYRLSEGLGKPKKRQKYSNRKKQLCVTCGKLVNNLPRHTQCHTKANKHACPHCSITMNDSSNLLRHIQAVHLKKVVISCEICGKGFTHNNTYKSHMRAWHNIGETFECKICLRSFNHPGGLRDHFNRFHNNETKHECETCGKKFKIKQALKVHERVHSTDQPFNCTLCPKRFKSSFARKTHELTHSGAQFKCVLCGKSYRYKSLLNMHVKKCHHQSENEFVND